MTVPEEGREDLSPYPRVFEPGFGRYEGGVRLIKQDAFRGDGMPIIRKLDAGGEDGRRRFYLGLELWRDPPREYPPCHAGDKSRGVGILLDLDEAAALWSSLGEWISEETARRATDPEPIPEV